MALVSTGSRHYENVEARDNSYMHLGDVYNGYLSPDERALKAILESLSYPGMTDRRDSLAEAHEKTFDWTFLEGNTRFPKERSSYGDQQWISYETVDMNFKSWLQQKDHGLFCVTGKPGSGKSTFVKTLAANTEATTILQSWAEDSILLRCDHFFWLLGAPMQKSVEGLLRNVLYSVLLGLSRCEMSWNTAAMKHVCGSRLQSATVNGAWSRRELKQMLTRLGSIPRVKSFLLVDALDECEPQDRLTDLADEILWISRLPNVKVCVSCRPWDIFIRKFTSAPSLRLDQLTRRDMETYIEARLAATEEESNWNSEFRSKTIATRQLVYRIARSSEGVFLWTELVVSAMCSEIRKGSKVEQLNQVISEIPTELDEYFDRLIFNRIGRSRQNIADTAATLKLAMILYASKQTDETDLPQSHPFPNHFMNYWLLSNGHLKPGFSWTDNDQIPLPSVSRMLDQTAGFLDETCKDLLGLNRATESVVFLHRTVFDFLRDNKIYETLDQNAPRHYWDTNFIFNLAQLFCICHLRAERISRHVCDSIPWYMTDVEFILRTYQHVVHMDRHQSWLLAIESLVVSEMRKANTYDDPWVYLDCTLMSYFVKAGLSSFVRELHRPTPCTALCTDNDYGRDLLGMFLQATNQSEIREPDLWLFRHILDVGCDPNRTAGRWPKTWHQRYHFITMEEDFDHPVQELPEWCLRTNWTAWLGESFLQLTRSTSESESNGMPMWRKQQVAAMINLLLQQGADPHCMICITDHWEDYDVRCRLITLEQLMEEIVPAESLMMLRDTHELCFNQATGYALRRNQRRRAIRSFQISKQFYEELANYEDAAEDGHLQQKLGAGNNLTPRALNEMADARDGTCKTCLRPEFFSAVLAVWCLDCGELSVMCYDCSERDPHKLPTLGLSCGGRTGDYGTAVDGHASVTFACRGAHFGGGLSLTNEDHVGYLRSRHTHARAVAVMKEWYAKDPIEPDLSFEDVVRSTRAALPFPLPPHRTLGSSTIIGEVSSESTGQGRRSNRPWLL